MPTVPCTIISKTMWAKLLDCGGVVFCLTRAYPKQQDMDMASVGIYMWQPDYKQNISIHQNT